MFQVFLFANSKNMPLTSEMAQTICKNSCGDAFLIHQEKNAYSFVSEIIPGNEPDIDIVVQPSPRLPKKLLISDMDSTMITVECIDELADFVGKKSHVAQITEKAMRGEIGFAEALKERVLLLNGLDEKILQKCFDERVKMMCGAKELVNSFNVRGAHSVLVSGGFTFFTKRVAECLGFKEHFGNQLEIENGKLTGRVIEPILGKEAKLSVLEDKIKQLAISHTEVLAIGDGANDLPMLKVAGLGVAFRAKPMVQKEVNARLNFANLDVLRFI